MEAESAFATVLLMKLFALLTFSPFLYNIRRASFGAGKCAWP
jgi:hypothetical protein